MKYFTFAICTLLLIAGTIGAGVIHGRMTNSWKISPTSRIAGERLKAALPEDFGNWRFDHKNEFPPEVLSILEHPAYFSRVYQHVQTGDTITIAVIAGQPGPVAVHTPEICYSARDYAISGTRAKYEVVAADGRSHSFWKLALDSRHADGMPLEVVYGWSTGTQWEATERPRYSFGGSSHLYKLQLAAAVPAQRNATEFNPVEDFLTGFLSQLQSKLVDSSERSSTPQ
jgi:Protein of unknown function (DUF3485)